MSYYAVLNVSDICDGLLLIEPILVSHCFIKLDGENS